MAKQKKTTKPAKQAASKRRYIRSKSTKKAKSKKKAASKKTSSKKKTTAVSKKPERTNLQYYNELKSEVSEFYKDQLNKKRIDRTFLTARTDYAFKILKAKAGPDGKINANLYKGFVNNLDTIMHKPANVVLKPDLIADTAIQIDYWNLELFIDKHKDELKEYQTVSIDMSSVLGTGNDQTEEDIDDLDTKTAIRDIKKFAIREGEKDNSQFLFFNVLKSKDNESLIFELVDTESPNKIRVVDGEIEETEIPEYEITEKPKPTGEGKEKKEEEKPEKLTAAEKAAIERDNKKGDLERLTMKKKSFQEDIAFNNKQMIETAGLIEVLKRLKVDSSDEQQSLLDYKKANKELLSDINDINKKIKDL